MGEIDRALAPTFASQHSLVTRRQVFAAGGTQRMIDTRIRNGTWLAAERGVYALPGVEWTWHRHLAAVVASVPRSVASHRAAAKLLGVGDFHEPPLELSVPDGITPRRSFGEREATAGVSVLIHQREDLALDPVTLVTGIPTTPPSRLAVDIGTKVSTDRYRTIVGDLRRQHGLSWEELDEIWRTHSRQGRDGCGPLHDLLDRHFGSEGAPSEVVEARCARLLVDAGLPEPDHQLEVLRPDGRQAYLDLAYPRWKIGIETEGKVHDWSEVRQADHTRRNSLQLLGWILFHFTWEDVRYRPAEVQSVVRAAIDQRRLALG